MSAPTAPAVAIRPLVTRRVSVEAVFFGLCIVLLTIGFYGFWGLLKLKVLYLAWLGCFSLALWLSLFGRVRLGDAVRDTLPMLAWIAYLFVSVLWSPSRATALSFGSASLLYPLVFVVSFVWARTVSRHLLAMFFEVNLLVIFPLLLWYLITRGDLPIDNLIPVRSEFAQRIVTGIPFVVWQLRNWPGIGRRLLLVAALVTTLAIQSRAVILVAPVMLLTSWVFIQREHGRVRAAVNAVGLIFVASVLALAIPQVRDLMSRSFGRFGAGSTNLDVSTALDELTRPRDEQTDIERRVALAVSFQSFLAHPIRGAGYFSTYAITGDLLPRPISAHGLPSTLLGETGLIGTLIFLWLIARYFRRLSRARAAAASPAVSAAERGFLQTCLVAMAGALILGLVHQVDQTTWLYVLLAWGYAAPGARSTEARGAH